MGRKGTGVEARDASIRISFTFEGKQRKETLKTDGSPMAPTPANLKYAARVGDEIREKIKHDTFVYAEYFPASKKATTGHGTTVGEQLDHWLGAQRIESSTRAGYETVIRFWKAEIGDKAVRALKHSDVLTALAKHQHLSGKTINNRTSVLRSAISLAVLDKTLPSSPLAELPRAKQQKPLLEPFTREESERIIAAVAQRSPGALANMVEFWFRTGLRTSELFGMRWGDVGAGVVIIRGALVAGVEKDSTKTNKVREVRLDARALAALERQKQHTSLPGQHVFVDPHTGKAWANTQAFSRRCWEPILRKLQIPHRRPYNIRHTRATEMLMAGLKPAFAAKQLGHDIVVFLTDYAKWLPGDGDDAEMAKLDRATG